MSFFKKLYSVSKLAKIPILVSSIVIILLFSYSNFLKTELGLPSGVDNYGYLNIAKSISEGVLLEGYVERPFYSELVAYLRDKYPLNSYRKLITPYAHSVNEHSYKIVNQYPLGVGLLLSWLPEEHRMACYPPICAFLLISFVLLAFSLVRKEVNLFDLAVVVVLISFFYRPPFERFSGSIYSASATFGMIIAAGYLFNNRPGISLFLMGLSSIFRVGNLLFFIPCLVVYLIQARPVRSIGDLLKRLSLASGLFFLGYLPQFIYVWCLLGNPFYSTYIGDDLRFARFNDVVSNVKLYLSGEIFYLHLVLLAVILLLSYRRQIKWFLIALSIFIINYTAIITHFAHAPYYPYASAMLLIGILLFLFQERLRIQNLEIFFKGLYQAFRTFVDSGYRDSGRLVNPTIKLIIFIVVIGYAFMALLNFSSRIRLHNIDHVQIVLDKTRSYESCFSKYDVIWADFHSGTIEYATSKAGFRYIQGPFNVRNDIILWLRSHGYSQAIFYEKSLMRKRENIEKDLDKIGISFDIKGCEGIEDGRISKIYEII